MDMKKGGDPLNELGFFFGFEKFGLEFLCY